MQVDDVMTKKNGNKNEKTTIIITTTLKDQDYNNNRFNPLGLYSLKGFILELSFDFWLYVKSD